MSATAANTAPAALAAPAASAREHELLLVRRGERSGAHTIVAVHSTVLGPALGGCRLWRYRDLPAAMEDALRLSRAMTLKAAAAQLPLGGGKAVIYPPPDLELSGRAREAILRDFADSVNMLDGLYITAEDVGTTSADMAFLSEHTQHVVGAPARRGGSGDPGAFTAAGVRAAMRACARSVLGSPDLAARRVAIVGLGHVGEPLARALARDGARLILGDIDASKRELAAELGAAWEPPERALRAEVDVLAPCALGGVLDEHLTRELRARIVCGAANNQLSSERVAALLAARGILYAPDFIANAGGLMNVSLELTGYDPEIARGRIAAIEEVLREILEHAERASVTPLAAALELADRRIAAARVDVARAPRPMRAVARSSRRPAARRPARAGSPRRGR